MSILDPAATLFDDTHVQVDSPALTTILLILLGFFGETLLCHPLTYVLQLSKVQEVQMDSNPYKSPPPELLAEGISTVMQYVRVRMQRIKVMHKLILKRCEPCTTHYARRRLALSVKNFWHVSWFSWVGAIPRTLLPELNCLCRHYLGLSRCL